VGTTGGAGGETADRGHARTLRLTARRSIGGWEQRGKGVRLQDAHAGQVAAPAILAS
jgi:hypothetical protein